MSVSTYFSRQAMALLLGSTALVATASNVEPESQLGQAINKTAGFMLETVAPHAPFGDMMLDNAKENTRRQITATKQLGRNG